MQREDTSSFSARYPVESSEDDEAFPPTLSADDILPARPKSPLRHRHDLQSTIKLLSVTVICLSIIMIVARASNSYLKHMAIVQHVTSPVECGRPGEEARRSGCHYDFISGAFVYPECHDKELEEEFLALRDWKWFADEAMGREATVEEVRRTGGPNPLYVSIEYHDAHCAYTWKKLHRAIIGRTKIDSQIGSIHHTLHCSDTVFRNRSADPPMSRFGHKSTFCLDPRDASQVDGKGGVHL